MHVALFLASASDEEFAAPIMETLKEFGVPLKIFTLSAHKVPEKVFQTVTELNTDAKPMVIITCVGMSNGLSGVVAGSSVHPVIACPVFKDKNDYLVNIHSTLQMPSEVPVMTVLDPRNAALAAMKILAEGDASLRKKIEQRIVKVKGKY